MTCLEIAGRDTRYPVGYQILVWESLRVMAKRDTGHTEGNSEKEEGRDAGSASQADGNRKGRPEDSEGSSAAGWGMEESECG